jgi:hypothetical protein
MPPLERVAGAQGRRRHCEDLPPGATTCPLSTSLAVAGRGGWRHTPASVLLHEGDGISVAVRGRSVTMVAGDGSARSSQGRSSESLARGGVVRRATSVVLPLGGHAFLFTWRAPWMGKWHAQGARCGSSLGALGVAGAAVRSLRRQCWVLGSSLSD